MDNWEFWIWVGACILAALVGWAVAYLLGLDLAGGR